MLAPNEITPDDLWGARAKDLVKINFPEFLASTFAGATLVAQGE
jgi:hypothetical protein